MLGRHDQVNVIAHETISLQAHAGVLPLVAQQVQVDVPVARLAKYILPICAPLGHMIGVAR